MASRFRVSKYKNQTLKLPDRPPKSTFSLPNSPSGASNWVTSSGYLTAYLTGADELSISSFYGETPEVALSSFRANGLSDFSFSPFHDDLLALVTNTGSLRVYRVPVIPTENQSLHVKSSDSGQFIDWTLGEGHSFQALQFHPLVDSLLATVELDSSVSLYDITKASTGEASRVQTWNSGLKVKSFDFNTTGTVAALGGFDLLEGNNNNAEFTIALYDVRSNEAQCTAQWDNILPGSDARVVYLDGPSANYLLTSSIDRKKHRTVASWDVRSLDKPVSSFVDFQSSTHIFLPLYDADTGVVYFALKNGNYLSTFEVSQLVSSAQSFDVTDSAQSIAYSIKGATLAPKRVLDVMKTELNRLLLLTNQLLYPLSYHVPRKTYFDFHADLYPPIRSPDCRTTVSQLLDPSKPDLPSEGRVSLNPQGSSASFLKLLRFDREIGVKATSDEPPVVEEERLSTSSSSVSANSASNSSSNQDSPSPVEESTSTSRSKMVSQDSFESVSTSSSDVASSASGPSKPPVLKPKPKAVRPMGLKKFSTPAKCKYLKGHVANRQSQLTNVQNICKNISPLCDPFKANAKYGLFPLGTGVGGGCNQVAVVDLLKPTRLSGGVQSHLLASDVVTDFALDPFRSNRAAVGIQSGAVLLFTISPPEETNLNIDGFIVDTPDCRLVGHNGRVTTVAFHPLATDILASCGTDNRVLIWNIATEEILFEINLASEGETQIFSIAWSRTTEGGTRLAILGRSRKLYIFNVQTGELVQQGTLPYKVNNGRVLFISGDQLLLVTGFNGLSERQFYLYDAKNLSAGILVEHGLDVSPSILVPTFDEDTRTLFLTGKGDSTIYAFEIAEFSGSGTSTPTATSLVTPLSHFDTSSPHQAVSFLPKNALDVKSLEFARGYRLTGNSVEPVSFTVPRLNMEYFHDDIFPETIITWSPLFSASEWSDLAESSNPELISLPERVSLQPEGMQKYSEVKDQLAAEKLEKSQSNRSIGQGSSAGSAASGVEGMDDATFMHNFQAMVAIGKEKQELLVQQMSGKVEFNSAKTNLEAVEGVDPDEWDD